ncbi:hypothetical protein AK812_SmicGene2676 [Symbiodinium microadriaticum]|uniref:Uncharacterized protein n=1 Tax=Symbiodinium microadriaticum TaxID=2951 RepID=A0A1Q9F0U5_SYMMI|nr:hypothetical protein AK812_SmicGene2676 [Symbiodinium microadriaticum]
MDGKPWTLTEESMRFPIDPPLSDVGRVEVVRAATIVKDFADRHQPELTCEIGRSHSQLHIVVSSLFLRCVQTAVEVCKKLGPGTKLMLDNALGDPGSEKSMDLAQGTSASCCSLIVKKPCGSAPEWPESLRKARHADCIASILALVPGKEVVLSEKEARSAWVGLESWMVRERVVSVHTEGAGGGGWSAVGENAVGGASKVDLSFLEELLGGLSEEPLGDVTPQSLKPQCSVVTLRASTSGRGEGMSDTSAFSEEGTRNQREPAPERSDDLDLVSSCSSSTYLYGIGLWELE